MPTKIAYGLALLTPGAALLLVQQWTPTLVALAGLVSTALALAIRNFRKIADQETRIRRVEVLAPKRSTDQRATSAFVHDASPLPRSMPGAPVTVAGSPVSGTCGVDG